MSSCDSVNKPAFCEKIKEKAGLIYVLSFSDFQTFSTVLIFFVYLLRELLKSLENNMQENVMIYAYAVSMRNAELTVIQY